MTSLEAGAIVDMHINTPPPEDRDTSPMKVLLVDDYPQNLDALAAVLADMDLDLVKAGSGEEALRHLLRMDFALILLDVKMPIMDGFEAARMIRRRPRSANTPIIFLTAYQPDEKQIFEGYKTGAVDYIAKPIVAEILRSKVAVFTDLFEKTRQLRRMNETLEQQVTARTAELRKAEAKFRHIIEYAMDGIYQIDANRRFTIANPAMAEILGYPDANTLIDAVKDAQRDLYVDRDDFDRLRGELVRDGFVAGFEVRMRRRDGRIIWVSESARQMHDEAGSPAGHEGMIRDITERRRAEDQIAAKNKDLQTLLYVTSHDLKEPLRGILGYSREIIDAGRESPELPDTYRKTLNRISEEAHRLDALIDSVRTLIQAQQISAEMQEVTAERLVQQALAPLQRRIQETGAEIVLAPDLPVLVANERWVVHAITNLVSNAIKFTKPGTKPHIEIVNCPAEKCGEGLGLIIRDRGIGVHPQHRERIFELFKRGTGHDVEGTGAGLAIVAQIAKGHGGRVWVEEREGGGSAFHLVLGTLPDVRDACETD